MMPISPTLLLYTLSAVAGVLLVLANAWLYENRRYNRKRSTESCPHLERLPHATVIIPCLDYAPGLRDNIESYLRQDYSNFEVIFVVRDRNDRVANVVKSIIDENRFLRLKMTVSAQIPTSSHVLETWLTGVGASAMESSVFAFGSSDVKVNSGWLRWILHGLSDTSVGVVTGALWCDVRHHKTGNRLKSVLQNTFSSFFGPGRQYQLCSKSWGVRRDVFEQAELKTVWQQAIDESWSTLGAILSARLQVRYEPQCRATTTIETSSKRSLRELFRRNVVERIHTPGLTHSVNATLLITQCAYWATLVATIQSAMAMEWMAWVWGSINVALFALGAYRAVLKYQIAKLHVGDWNQARRLRQIEAFTWPFLDALYLGSRFAALFTNSINWNGFRYRLSRDGSGRLVGRSLRLHHGEATDVANEKNESRAA
ncbi:MAG: glycosyltransferase [Pirellulaceae bacterium]